MIDGDKILEALREKWHSGQSQSEIARNSGISQAYLCDLISGKSDVTGLTLKKINTIFPNAILQLDGDSVSIHADYNSGNVVGVNRGKVSADCLSAVMDKILECDELSAEEKVKVMKVLKK